MVLYRDQHQHQHNTLEVILINEEVNAYLLPSGPAQKHPIYIKTGGGKILPPFSMMPSIPI